MVRSPQWPMSRSSGGSSRTWAGPEKVQVPVLVAAPASAGSSWSPWKIVLVAGGKRFWPASVSASLPRLDGGSGLGDGGSLLRRGSLGLRSVLECGRVFFFLDL